MERSAAGAKTEARTQIERAARAGRIVTVVWLCWTAVFLLTLLIPFTTEVYSPLGIVRLIVLPLYIAVMAVVLILLGPLAVHELGHVAAGLVVGFRPDLLIVGPWGWRRVDGRMRFYWTGAWLAFDGLAHGLPKDTNRLRVRECIHIAGGPAASLLLALPGMKQGYYLQILRPILHTPPFPENPGLIWPFAVVLGLFSAGIFVSSVVPRRHGVYLSDGATLLLLARGGPAAERYAAISAMATDLRTGLPPSAWPESWVECATSIPDGSADDALGCYFAHLWHMARKEYDAAGKALNRALVAEARLPAEYRAELQRLSAHFEAEPFV